MIVSIISSCTEKYEFTDDIHNAVISVNKIYGDGSRYCAFTSLIKRDFNYYLAFREGSSHIGVDDYGVIRILKSNDLKNWRIIATISEEFVDLRDPNLSIMPDGNILLICGARIKEGDTYITKTYYAKEYQENFSNLFLANIRPKNGFSNISWVWKVTWHGGKGYGVCYGNNKAGDSFSISLVATNDGEDYEILKNFSIEGSPSEARVRFTDDNTMIILLRRGPLERGMIGSSKPPYSEWEWRELNVYLAGQDFIIDEDRIICVTRTSQDVFEKTCVYWGQTNGNFEWSYILPSSGKGGDTSYGSILAEDNEYVISYYSMHETEKPSIYIVTIPKLYYPLKK